MKRVVIITNIPSPYRIDLFYYLQRNMKEYNIHILYASQNEDNRDWEIEKDKMINSHILESFTIKIPYRFDTKYIHISKSITKILNKLQPDIVVGSEYNLTALQALQYCKRRKIPYISWTDGTLHTERNINRMQRWSRKHIIKHASAYLASSTKSKEAQLTYGALPEKCFVSFITVDLEKYKIQQIENRSGNRIIYVGRLIELKGIDLLFQAVQEIEEEYTLVLAGAGPEEKNLRKLAKKLGIEGKVQFLGGLSREELKKEYAKSDIFVLPTRQDCFALVILEAMCASLPVVCSKYAAGAYDLIEEGKNGYIVDPYMKEQMQNCIQELLQNPEQAKQMGENSMYNLWRFRFEEVSKGFGDAFAYVEGK